MVIFTDRVAGLDLTGSFQRDPDEVAKELREIKEGKYQIPATKDNGKFNFNVHILHYNPDSGLFIARGRDHFGESGIVGILSFPFEGHDDIGSIKFEKIYVKNRKMSVPAKIIQQGHIDWHQNLRVIEYVGDVERGVDYMHAGGKYHIIGNNQVLNGIWELSASQ